VKAIFISSPTPGRKRSAPIWSTTWEIWSPAGWEAKSALIFVTNALALSRWFETMLDFDHGLEDFADDEVEIGLFAFGLCPHSAASRGRAREQNHPTRDGP
jgi:hypothetical protein